MVSDFIAPENLEEFWFQGLSKTQVGDIYDAYVADAFWKGTNIRLSDEELDILCTDHDLTEKMLEQGYNFEWAGL